MQTSEEINNKIINHLEFCLEKLQYKDNGFNTSQVFNLYMTIMHTVNKMKELPPLDSLEYFSATINDNVRKELLSFNIDLIV